jgi:hypothetical protein
MKDMVSAAVGEGTLERHQVGDLLDDAEGCGVALRVAADFAEWSLS